MASTTAPPQTAMTPPPGVEPNLTDPTTMATATIATVAVCFTATTIPFLLRTYVRAVIKRAFDLQDFVVLLSWLGLDVYWALTLVALHFHAGTHEYDLLKSQVPDALYWLNANSTTYGLAIMVTKISVLMLYSRVFFPTRWSRSDILIKILIFLLLGFYIGTTPAKIWQCLPRQHIWDKSVPGTCIDIAVLFNVSGFFNAVTDFVILFIPIRAVWTLNMKRQRKLGVLGVFAVGSIAPIFSIVGLIVRFQVGASPDLTWNQLQISLWAGAEVSTGLIAVCLPELPYLWRSRRNASSPYTQSSLATRDGASANAYGSSVPRARTGTGERALGKRDLEYGDVLLDTDSDTPGNTLEMESRQSPSIERHSERDVGLAVSKYPVPVTSSGAASQSSHGRAGNVGIAQSVGLGNSWIDFDPKGKSHDTDNC